MLMVGVPDAAHARKARRGKGKATTTQTAKPAKRGNSKTELQRKEADARKEIAATKAKIKENDREVRRNLNELGKLEGDIDATKAQVANSTRQVNMLQKQIGVLEQRISGEEKELARLRAEYLKAVKRVRAKRKSNSDLAYLFSARSLSEARQRMRYLKEFSEWRKRQSGEIEGKVTQLRQQRSELARNKSMQDRALAAKVNSQRELETQYKQKDALVVELRRNGEALKNHLAQKQSEANALKGQVAALIAAEQRAAEQRAREEAARKAAEQRAREERERQLAQAEAQRQQEERAQQSETSRKDDVKSDDKPSAKDNKKSKDQPKSSKKRDNRKDTKKNAGKDNKGGTKGKDNNDNMYAEARKRRPRQPSATSGSGTAPSGSAPSAKSPARQGGGGFESMRGSLPRPVAGAFKVTSRFGPHSLPDLPDVMYDNPGIDAEVSVGAAAQAVFAGKVSGVYMIPGYSTVVIVNHGNYYTVYGNLSGTGVKVGDVVKQGQALGRVAAGEDDPSHGTIHFEVWKNREKQDPLKWIR